MGSTLKDLAAKAFKITAFLLILAVLLRCVSNVLTDVETGPDYTYQCFENFYAVPENTLDAVFIGSSRVHAFWTPMFAWAEKGLATASFAATSLPVRSVRFLVEEAHKTQPGALIVVNLDDFRELLPELAYYGFAYMKPSMTRLRGIARLAKALGSDFEETLSFVFPLIRFHSRWNGQASEPPKGKADGYLGSLTSDLFFEGSEDFSGPVQREYAETGAGTLKSGMRHALDDLTAYCEREGIRIRFFNTPQAVIPKDLVKQRKAAMDYLASKGYTVTDLQPETEKAGIGLLCDFYNGAHTNVHGSAKYTRFVSDILIAEEGLKDRRGDPRYAFMEEGAGRYTALALKHLADFELTPQRDYLLSVPAKQTAAFSGEDTAVTWQPAEGASGYAVYLKQTADAPWVLAGTTEKTVFVLNGTKKENRWTVVPYSEKDGVKYYGNFDYRGFPAE